MPKLKPPLEKEVQQHIREYMAAVGWVLLCDSSQGYRPEGGTRVTVGFPDLLFGSPKHEVALFVEVKRPGRGRLTAHQKAWHAMAEQCGQRVIVADSAGAVAEYLQNKKLL